MQYEDKQTLSAETDGKIEMIATPFTKKDDGTFEFILKGVSGGEKKIVYDAAKPDQGIVFHPQDTKKEYPYWKLMDGDRVSDGQVLCVLDDQLWKAKEVAAIAIKKSSVVSKESADKGVDYSKQKVELDRLGQIKGAVPLGDLLNDLITLERFVENLAQAVQSIAKAEVGPSGSDGEP